MFDKFLWKHQGPSSATPEVGQVAAVKTSMGFVFSFHVFSESDKSERTSLATEGTEICDTESLWFLVSNLACLHASRAS